jgi:ATP/ADP translocase
MSAGQSRFLKVERGEWASLMTFVVVLAVNALSLEGAYVIATSGFLSEVGVRQLPLLWLVDMTVILLSTALYSLVIDRWRRRSLVQGTVIFLAAFYAVIRWLFAYGAPDWLTYPLLYVVAEQQLMLFPLALWALANDLYTVAQAKRLFPFIAAGGVVGSILGNGLAAGSASLLARRGLGSHELLILNGAFLLGSYLLLQGMRRHLNPSSRRDAAAPIRDTLREGWDFVRNVASFRYLALAMLGVGSALTFIEYHFLATASDTFVQPAQFQTFYGLFRIGQTLATLTVQGLLTSRIIQRVKLKSVFMILPAACVAVVTGVLALPGLLGIAAARMVGRVLIYGLDEPARKSLQGLIPDERRGRVSAFLDGYLYAVGTIAACLLLAGLLGAAAVGWLAPQVTAWTYLTLALFVAAGALWAAWRLRGVYDTSLLNWRLARRRRRSVSINLDF